jgi:hypothetical protein
MAKQTYLKLLLILAAAILIFPSVSATTFSPPNPVSFHTGGSVTYNLTAPQYLALNANEIVTGCTASPTTNIKTQLSGLCNVTFSAQLANWVGSEQVNVTVITNASPYSYSSLITATATNSLPTLSDSVPIKVRIGTTQMQLNATDADGDSITFGYDHSAWTAISSITSSGLITFASLDSEKIGYHVVPINLTDNRGGVTSLNVEFLLTYATDDGKLTYSDFTANDVNTDSETEFYPGDSVDVSFTLYNHLSVDINHAKVKAWIEDANGKKTDYVEPDSTTISANDNVDENFNMTVPLDFSLSSDSYPLYLFVQSSGVDENGTTRSVLYVKEMDISRNDHDLAFDTTTITPSPALCGQTADITVDFWNIGVNKETVRLNVKNSDLGINAYSDPFDVKDSGSSREAVKTISVLLGDNIKPGDYTLDISATYNSGKDTKGTTATMTVVCSGYVAGANEGNGNAGAGALTFASTTIDGKQGQQSKISATLKNTGTTAAVYTFELSGIQDWASGFVEPDTVTLAGGASTDIFVYVTPKTSATGDNTATLTAKSGGTVVETETLTVKLPAKPTLSITSLGNMPNVDETAALLIIVGIIVVISLIILGKKRAAASAVETYGNKRRGRKSPEEE